MEFRPKDPSPPKTSSEEDARGWQELASEGYTIKPFLDAGHVEALQQLHALTIPNLPGAFYISVFSALETRRAILEGFQSILKDSIETLAPGFRLVAASFVTKMAGTGDGRVGLHQDSSLVDHRKDLGINVWVPLCDVDERNGCLRVAGRSHRFNGIGSLPPFSGPHAAFERELAPPSITSLRMKAGESCLFDTRLLHASEENRSDTDRVAVFFSLVPEDRPIRLYFRNPELPGQLDIFQVDNEFLLRLDPLHYPDAVQREAMTLIGSFKHVQRKLLAADFAALHADAAVQAEPDLAMVNPEQKPVSSLHSSLWTRLRRRFQ